MPSPGAVAGQLLQRFSIPFANICLQRICFGLRPSYGQPCQAGHRCFQLPSCAISPCPSFTLFVLRLLLFLRLPSAVAIPLLPIPCLALHLSAAWSQLAFYRHLTCPLVTFAPHRSVCCEILWLAAVSFSCHGLQFYLGKRVAYVYRAERARKKRGSFRTGLSKVRVIWGRVTRSHGSTGAVRAKFRVNLPPTSFGASCRVVSLIAS